MPSEIHYNQSDRRFFMVKAGQVWCFNPLTTNDAEEYVLILQHDDAGATCFRIAAITGKRAGRLSPPENIDGDWWKKHMTFAYESLQDYFNAQRPAE